MPNNLELTAYTIERFERIQRHMLLAKKESAAETYDSLRREYIYLKAILSTAGVNLTELDEIKE